MEELQRLTAWFDNISQTDQARAHRRRRRGRRRSFRIPIARWNARRSSSTGQSKKAFALIEFRGFHSGGVLAAGRRNENQEDYEVVVDIDRQGQRREGMVFFSRPWHGFGPDDVDVRWDET